MSGLTGIAAKIAVPAVVKTIPWKLIFDGAIALAFLVLIAWSLRINDLRGRWQHQYQSEHAGRLADRAAYTKAQTDAAALNKVQVAAKEAQSKGVSDNERQAYLADLAKLRADDQRLRQQVASSAQRPAGTAAPSTPSAPTSGANADGLPVSPDEHLQAAEIELRLMHLQNWVEQQLAINPN